jgi:hypothetical protein
MTRPRTRADRASVVAVRHDDQRDDRERDRGEHDRDSDDEERHLMWMGAGYSPSFSFRRPSSVADFMATWELPRPLL